MYGTIYAYKLAGHWHATYDKPLASLSQVGVIHQFDSMQSAIWHIENEVADRKLYKNVGWLMLGFVCGAAMTGCWL